MNEFVAVTSTNIARILNVCPQKGVIAVGADADPVAFEPAASKTISAATQKSVIYHNVFEGFTVTSLPRYTLSHGTVFWGPNGGRPQPGKGRPLQRSSTTGASA